MSILDEKYLFSYVFDVIRPYNTDILKMTSHKQEITYMLTQLNLMNTKLGGANASKVTLMLGKAMGGTEFDFIQE